jgi:predicted amidohydrolase
MHVYKKILAGIIQMNSGDDKNKNIRIAEQLICEASAKGARIIALPELFNWRGSSKDMHKNAETIPGPTIERLSLIASSNKIFLLAGSILEKSTAQHKVFNTSVLLNSTGAVTAVYRKIHLFQCQLHDGRLINEARVYLPGSAISCAHLPFCKAGFSICYDVRFPELYRALASKGVSLIFVPSAFTSETGELHWEVLLRARAIENQAYVLAPNQYGLNPQGYRDYGHSMIINPLGEIIASAANKEASICAELDFEFLQRTRKEFPVLKQRNKRTAYGNSI